MCPCPAGTAAPAPLPSPAGALGVPSGDGVDHSGVTVMPGAAGGREDGDVAGWGTGSRESVGGESLMGPKGPQGQDGPWGFALPAGPSPS